MKKYLILGFVLLAAVSVKAQTTLRSPKGLSYVVLKAGNGQKLKLDDIVTLQMVQTTEKDSVLFSTYKVGHPLQIKLGPAQNNLDPMDVFPLLAVNDSVMIKVPTDSVFKGHEQERPPYLPVNSNIIFRVKIEKVQTLDEAIAERKAAVAKMEQSESVNAEKYIADNKLALKTTPSGLKYMITSVAEKGSGKRALAGDTVLVNYVGRTVDGKVFDSSIEAVAKEANLQQPNRVYQPIKVILGQGQVIPGWDEGLMLVPEGAAAKLVIPSKLAYGAQGAGQDIAPFSTLVFDVIMVRIFPAKHTPPVASKTPVKSTKTATKKTTTTKKAVKKSN
ncbi:FKBP-type peptidyl-prolyl cis-trans isomerase [Mucilaginibacter sp. RS28]|uniref:peptidylprolyl isomerase n=1 Tax=Mucilaginibacter straminoryzae TaxID=2932774 RepID=A0A9X1X5J6_9SPHI|nr:FKBP-type peptidyl-prolyl cis-trans isomerase [Mucilaginibacter straminoryzae]MCJ8211376.1 FKBP-type peptidyl-prolyl cis-trans isomerase [Mucilaginibacter straminoryzae]